MKLVVDANVLFSFFKKDSTTRRIILDPDFKYNLELYAPEFVMEEIGRHKDEICSMFGIATKDFDTMFMAIKLFVRIVPKNSFEAFLPKATEALSPHIKDAPYVALSLWLYSEGHKIRLWSNEKRLRTLEEHGVSVISTSGLVEEFGL
ncbi:MAG: hypothetical protein HYW25_06075 [Candidatus Aenigmarchaeota archaeon]|nr:hypothetical protein [Candidatus Aenigmarchaeota archaeon]